MGELPAKGGPIRLRVGDEERHRTAELLTEHHAHGRLTDEEFEERIGAALTAQTTAEVGRVLADLPVRPSEHPGDDALVRAARPGNRRIGFNRVTVAAGGAAAAGVSAVAAIFASAAYTTGTAQVAAIASGVVGVAVGGVVGRLTGRRRGPKDPER